MIAPTVRSAVDLVQAQHQLEDARRAESRARVAAYQAAERVAEAERHLKTVTRAVEKASR